MRIVVATDTMAARDLADPPASRQQRRGRSSWNRFLSKVSCGRYGTENDEGCMRGEIVLITGGGSGLGRLMALEFARLGGCIVIWDMNTSGSSQTASMIKKNGGEAYDYFCDVSKSECVYEVAKKVKNDVGIVTILINNAGIVSGKEFLKLDEAKVVKTFEVNVFAHFWTCKAFLPDMIEAQKGHIVSIASVAGQLAFNDLADYSASKFAAIGFDEALRLEINMKGYRGVYTTAVCPFVMSTQMFAGASSPVFKILDPCDVARKVVKAVRKKKTVVMIPRYFVGLTLLKHILPHSAIMGLYNIIGARDSMANFVGHGNQQGQQASTEVTNVNL